MRTTLFWRKLGAHQGPICYLKCTMEVKFASLSMTESKRLFVILVLLLLFGQQRNALTTMVNFRLISKNGVVLCSKCVYGVHINVLSKHLASVQKRSAERCQLKQHYFGKIELCSDSSNHELNQPRYHGMLNNDFVDGECFAPLTRLPMLVGC